MDAALGWIGQIIEWFGQFIPRILILDPTMGAIKCRRGNEISELKAGIHIYWPIITIVKIFPVARQTLDLTSQTFETKDGVTVMASGMVAYMVTDIITALTEMYDPDNTLRDITMATIQEVLVQYTWDELRDRLVDHTLKKELVREAQRVLKGYGLKVLSVGIKDLARTRVLKISVETSTDGIN